MSFWDLSDGETVKAETEYEAPQGGGNFDPIPHNTDVMDLLTRSDGGIKTAQRLLNIASVLRSQRR
jgi:hypothetical protein